MTSEEIRTWLGLAQQRNQDPRFQFLYPRSGHSVSSARVKRGHQCLSHAHSVRQYLGAGAQTASSDYNQKGSRQASRTFIASTRAHCLGLLCATHGLIATPMSGTGGDADQSGGLGREFF